METTMVSNHFRFMGLKPKGGQRPQGEVRSLACGLTAGGFSERRHQTVLHENV